MFREGTQNFEGGGQKVFYISKDSFGVFTSVKTTINVFRVSPKWSILVNRVSKEMDGQPTLKNNPCSINLDAKVKNIKLYTLTSNFSCHTPSQSQKK